MLAALSKPRHPARGEFKKRAKEALLAFTQSRRLPGEEHGRSAVVVGSHRIGTCNNNGQSDS